MKKLIFSILIIALGAFLFEACSPNTAPGQTGGFRIKTLAFYGTTNVIPTTASVQGVFTSATGSTTGTTTSFNQESNGGGDLIINDGKVPGNWQFRVGPTLNGLSHCLGYTFYDQTVSANDIVHLQCQGSFFRFEASPESLDALNPPATMTLTGDGLDDTYAVPVIAFYDELGNVVASAPASHVNWQKDGIHSVDVSVPELNLVYDGIYTARVNNVLSDGSWELVGAAPLTVSGNPPPIGGGGGGGDECIPTQRQLPCEIILY